MGPATHSYVIVDNITKRPDSVFVCKKSQQKNKKINPGSVFLKCIKSMKV